MEFNESIVSSEGFEFIGGAFKFVSCFFCDLLCDCFCETEISVKTSSDSSAALCELADLRDLALHSLNTISDLLGIASKLLAKSKRSGILSVSSSDFDDVFELS